MNHHSAESLRYGNWTLDDAGLPAFDLHLQDDDAPDMPFSHLISSGHLSTMADRWGNVNLFTTEEGFRWLNPKGDARARSSIYLMMESGGELISLLHSELAAKEKIRVGTGYIEYHGEARTADVHLRVTQQVFAAPDKKRSLHARFNLVNLSNIPLTAKFYLRADANGDLPRDEIFLAADDSWQPSAHRHTLIRAKTVQLPPGGALVIDCTTGYGEPPAICTTPAPGEVRQQWAAKLSPFAVAAPEEWMRQECLWNAGQLLSFTSYDSSVNEYYVALGGYGWREFGVREVCETSMVLAECDWELAAASLRFVAKTQFANGDIPKMHTMRRDRPTREFESDNELWFLIGVCESLVLSGKHDLLDEVCAFWDQGEGSIWEHLKRAFYWVRDGVGRGKHGLILIREGDWNDYLSLIGAEGRGESVMNSGMACRAFAALAVLAKARGEEVFAREVSICADEIRRAINQVFDQGWFLRGYTDEGKPVGSYQDDRLFINAQSWCALGKCGTPEQRRAALKNAVAKCHTDIGLMLMSRPYSSPAPSDISWCAIPAGEGENSGIWPQTVYWMVWALAEEGLLGEALQEWTCGTLRNHARRFPSVPFGIFNGPDCFSSKWSGKREGWTQTQLVDRAHTVPMNPMVAWQGFAMRKIIVAVSKKNTNMPR
jgi:hypothetical protein